MIKKDSNIIIGYDSSESKDSTVVSIASLEEGVMTILKTFILENPDLTNRCESK